MKTHMMILLMMLSACACGVPKIEPQERCVVSFTFDKCRCHMYDIMSHERVSDAYDMDVEYCDDVIGFRAKVWLEEITPWMKELFRWWEDRNGK